MLEVTRGHLALLTALWYTLSTGHFCNEYTEPLVGRFAPRPDVGEAARPLCD